MLSLSEVTLICEKRQKYAHFESLICEKKLALGGSAKISKISKDFKRFQPAVHVRDFSKWLTPRLHWYPCSLSILASASEKWVAWRQWAVFSAVSSWQKTFTTPGEYLGEFG